MPISYLKSKGKLGNFDGFFSKREKNVSVSPISKVNICYLKSAVNELHKFTLCHSSSQESTIGRERQVPVPIRLYTMSDPDSVGEHSDKRVKQVTNPQGLPGDEAGGAEGVVEGGQNVFYSVDSVPPVYLMVLFGLQVNVYIMSDITLCAIF